MAAEAKIKPIWGTGRRKTAVARVRLIQPGDGKILINDRPLDHFFTEERHRRDVVAPLEVADLLGKVDVLVRIHGGGITGQAGAVMLGVARAIKKFQPDMDKLLRDNGFLTRDSRMKERKKYGLAGARKRYQFSKR